MMKILVIAPRLPYPLFSGGEHAQFHFIDRMRETMDVSFCFELNERDYNSSPAEFEALKNKWHNVHFYPYVNINKQSALIKAYRTFKRKAIAPLFNLLAGQKNEENDFTRHDSYINNPYFTCEPGFVSHVKGIVEKHAFDCIQVEFIHLAPLVYVLPATALKILVHHEIRFVRVKRELDLFKQVTPYDLFLYESIKDQEISLLRHFDKIITLTDIDKSILGNHIAGEKIYTSPATIQAGKHHPGEKFSPFVNKLVFIGSSLHLPNKDAMKWFIESVMPFVEKKNPGIHLEIIGSWDKAFVKAFTKKNVRFTGYVEKLEDVVSGSLLIVPIRIGSGMRLKIIEAVNHNIPFVTTSIGVEGMSFENNIDCMIADSAESFAQAIVHLQNNPALQKLLVENAAGTLKKNSSFENAIGRRLDFYKTLQSSTT